jgi:hypothetical protein
MQWALINLGNYTKKIRVNKYTVLVNGIYRIFDEDDNEYITHMSNAIISSKEPVIKEYRSK